MSQTSLPKPLSAYVGLLIASLEDAKGASRSTAALVAHLPLAAAGQALTARRRYDELAEHGEVVLDAVIGLARQCFGAGAAEASEWIGDELASLNGARSTAVHGTVELLASRVEIAIADTLDEAAETLEDTADRLNLDAAEVTETVVVAQPPEEPAPTERLEQYGEPAESGAEAGGLKTAADLPLADFDNMTGPQLRGRLRTLDRVQLVQLLDYERAHTNRAGIVLMLENRLTKLIAG